MSFISQRTCNGDSFAWVKKLFQLAMIRLYDESRPGKLLSAIPVIYSPYFMLILSYMVSQIKAKNSLV